MSRNSNNYLSGDFQSSMNSNWQQFQSPRFSEERPHLELSSVNQHSSRYIPSQNYMNFPPPPPFSPSQSPSNFNSNTSNTHSFQNNSGGIAQPAHSTRPQQSFYSNIGNQTSQVFNNYSIQTPQTLNNYDNPQTHPLHNCGHQPTQPFYNHGNQPPQKFQNLGNQPLHAIPYNHTSQPSTSSKIDGFTSSEGHFQPRLTSLQQPLSPSLRPTPSVDFQHCQETNILPISSLRAMSPEEDLWMNKWLNNVQIRINEVKKENETSKLKISRVQKKLLRYAILVKDLNNILDHLSSTVEHVDQDEWKNTVKKSENIKNEIEELQGFFEDEQTILKIQEMLSSRREKRVKWRQRREERAKKRKRIREERRKKEMQMDERIKWLNQEEKEKLQEVKMKQEADVVLREVRSKQEDVVKMQKMLQALTKLREIRRNKGEIHGYVEDPRANVFFDKMKCEFDTLLQNQKNLYRVEEQTLQVMLEESRTIPQSKKVPRFFPNLQKLKKSIWELYFGKDESNDKEYKRSFLAAEESVEILVNRRKDWDQFLVPDDSPLGSSVPLGWVVPNSEPNEEWKPLLKSL